MNSRVRLYAATCIISLGWTYALYAQQPIDARVQAPPPSVEHKESESLKLAPSDSTEKDTSNPDKWEFEFAPYLWIASISSDVSAGPISVEDKVCFTDLLKHLDMGSMLRFEGRRDRWGFYLEGIYMGLSDDTSAKIGPFRLHGIDTDMRLDLAELGFGGMYRFGESDRSFDLMLGGRYTHIGTDVSIGPLIDVKSNIDFVAPVVGGRFQCDLSEKWLFSLKADVGGFGVGEAPDLTWGGTALLGYRLSKSATLAFGYRYYDIENAKGRIDMDVQFYGPMVGVAFKY
ncbi:MAG: hypothetical protein HY287_06570 [Planctomycetes bacterium]|nr:hypothetical protein [Planctomycetota bacterium]